MQTATVTLVSVNRDGTGSGNGASDSPSLSADGRFVAYRSFAGNIAAGDDNDQPDVFLFDRLTGGNTLVSGRQSGSGAGNNRSSTPVISSEGSLIVFRSVASDLISGDLNETQDVFAYAAAALTTVDSDGDGMDDYWEQGAFGNLSHNGLADSDGDGLSDLNEYRVGTNPTDASSLFQSEVARQSISGDVTLSWPAAPGRIYRIQYQNDLNEPTWTDLAGTITISGSAGYFRDQTTGAVSERFYRVIWLNDAHKTGRQVLNLPRGHVATKMLI